jgi:hypothetical protein
MLLATVSANAAEPILRCDAPTIHQGDIGKFPITAIAVWHDTDHKTSQDYLKSSSTTGAWKIHHFLSNDQMAEREKQYDIEERSTYYSSKWFGILRKNPFMTMKGGIERDNKTGKLYYYEQLYDNMGQAPKLEVHLAAWCEPPTTEGMPDWLLYNPPDVMIRVTPLRP